jgi:lipoate-protein ligase A
MTPLRGLVRIDPPASGSTNMAIDEALLTELTPQSPIMLRIYRWISPTLSLGHFQTLDQAKAVHPDSSWVRLPSVVRKTGGGAIVHDLELTYCLAISNFPGLSLKGHSEAIYRSVHGALVKRLNDLGWKASLSEDCTCKTQSNGGREPFLCFLRRSPVDVLVESHKIMGSAQRRSNQGLLQHGSLLLKHSSTTPELLGLLDLLDARSLPPTLSEATDRVWVADGATPIGQADGAGHRDAKFWHFWERWLVSTIQTGLESVLKCDWEESKT